ncbi:ATP-dependent DNA helicase [Terricaulis silvestris]|uniref:Conjugal transfer relaxase TraA n=1 Tax=Terricaulis silvestris TaxID=2686094 RepID=A0A6I6MUE8_9CAUL|nr:DEAD/DEAH box helicase [Terricaulis silvestris]QGZ97086.1 conjugal transfer relaxase TraA [Terricaulis silvestris]
MILPTAPQPDPAVAEARAALSDRTPIVMVVGRAGTGKSHFIRSLVEADPQYPQAVLAPTGLAAMNIGGQTVHSFFGFPPRPLIGLQEKPHWFFQRTARAISRLIVDEVSMLRADVLDAMDQHLKVARKSSRPFGGVQMLLVGDFYQLPPVVRGEEGQLLEDAGYSTPYAFSAHCLRDAPIAAVQLTEVHRQTNQDFIALLSSIRESRGVEEAVTILNTVCLDRSLPKRPVLLCATNAVADRYNANGLASLETAAARYTGAFEGEPPKSQGDRFPAPMELVLKRGARVIFTQNDPADRWVNGSLGTVKSLDDELIVVVLDAGGEVDVERATWPQARWTWNAKENRMEVKEEFKYVQFPLAPAWALTIHKAQGMTLDSVEIDLGRGAFAPGQAYVALSRARSMETLRLTRPLSPRDVQVDPAIADGLARLGI